MSLRAVFLMMGFVTTAMIAAVIYFKVIVPPEARTMTVGEQRSLDRICYSRCEGKAELLAETNKTEETLKAAAQSCVFDCQRQLSGGSYPP